MLWNTNVHQIVVCKITYACLPHTSLFCGRKNIFIMLFFGVDRHKNDYRLLFIMNEMIWIFVVFFHFSSFFTFYIFIILKWYLVIIFFSFFFLTLGTPRTDAISLINYSFQKRNFENDMLECTSQLLLYRAYVLSRW